MMTTVVVAQSSSPSSIQQCHSSIPINSTNIDGSHQNQNQNLHQLGVEITHFSPLLTSYQQHQQQHFVASDPYHSDTNTEEEEEDEEGRVRKRRRERAVREGVEEEEEEEENWSVLTLFVTAFRKSLVRCYNNKGETEGFSASSSSWSNKMEIGVPTDVRHVAHVTFDRFDGFLGLPVEFEPEVPRRAPSASATVFGVSTNSMQLSFDSRRNSVPTILLMMQHRLYSLGGLEVEGIFRINAGNDQEEYVRDQLNRGVIPHDADVHCLAGLIKAWFRELPTGLLDTLSPEELMRCQTEEECAQLTRLLPLTEASLLDWAVNLMADIAQHESLNKMNARNVAVVFAPNMTHVMDPLTALVHAVQVMNFLKTLITRTLRERQDPILDPPRSSKDGFDETDPQSPLQTIFEGTSEGDDEDNNHKLGSENQPSSHHNPDKELFTKAGEGCGPAILISNENIPPNGNQSSSLNEDDECNQPVYRGAEVPRPSSSSEGEKNKASSKFRNEILIKYAYEKGQRRSNNRKMNQLLAEKARGNDLLSRINPESDRPEAWR